MMNRRMIQIALCGAALLSLIMGGTIVTAAPHTTAGKWWGDYFNSIDLSGGPMLSRYDDAINFNWGYGRPDDSISQDRFSARWVREDWFAGGTYRFSIAADDGVRVWVGDQLVVDRWYDSDPTTFYIDQYIPTGTYQVRVEYYENTGAALISVSWSPVVGGATWRGEYFDNRKLEGAPVLVRDDSAIDFDWDTGSPDAAVPGDSFSVRWTRSTVFAGGPYRFFTSTDDGVRLRVDGHLLIDAWYDQKLPNTHSGDINLSAGSHTVVVEYYEHGDKASAHVWWQALNTYGPWHGEYFDNPDLLGGPVMERNDADINFDWGVGPPADWMPDDQFSIRWTRTVDFAPGYYKFSVQSDDGFRLWLDDGLFIDKWEDMSYELHYVDGTYLEGQHTIKLEYYEHTGYARVRFWWGDGAPPPPPAPVATPVPAPGPLPVDEDDPWKVSYFDNPDLKGEPVLTRVEKVIDHNWGWGSPGEAVPVDNFSARWTQPIYFPGGGYRFTVYSDDGVRLWVDGKLLIDAWKPMRGYLHATVWLSEGVHDVKMEYFEGTGTARVHLLWERLGP